MAVQKKTVIYPLDEDGLMIAVEVEATPAEAERIATGGELVQEAGQTFTKALRTAEAAAAAVLSGFAQALEANDLELEFGIKFGSKAGVLLASADAQATLKLKATWRRESKVS